MAALRGSPIKSLSAHNLSVCWQCVFCGTNFVSEREKDLHSSSCSLKGHLQMDKIKQSGKTPLYYRPLPPPRHATGQASEDRVDQHSYLRSQSLDASLQDQRVGIIWKKERQTLETEITYFDNVNGAIFLKWNRLNNYFSTSTKLTPGSHSGCLTLSDTDYNGDVHPFYVLEKSDVIQEFILSLVSLPDDTKRNSVDSPRDGNTAKSLKKKLKECEGRIKELEQKCEKLTKENDKLKKEKDKSKGGEGKGKHSELENLRTTVMGLEIEKRANGEALSTIAAQKSQADIENIQLRKELDALKAKYDMNKIDFNKFTKSDEDIFWTHHDTIKTDKEKSSHYFNTDDLAKVIEIQKELAELKKKYEERDREAVEAKIKSDEIIEYLHGEKDSLESELQATKANLEIQDRGNSASVTNALPLPPKPQPSLNAGPSNVPSNVPSNLPNVKDQSSEYGPPKPFLITVDGKQISVLPLSYFNPKAYEKSIVYCQPTADSPHHTSCMLQCTFLDQDLGRLISGVSFFREVGTCDGDYKGVRYFGTEPNKATFLASDIVLVKVPAQTTPHAQAN